jgi:hypothetical protein
VSGSSDSSRTFMRAGAARQRFNKSTACGACPPYKTRDETIFESGIGDLPSSMGRDRSGMPTPVCRRRHATYSVASPCGLREHSAGES